MLFCLSNSLALNVKRPQWQIQLLDIKDNLVSGQKERVGTFAQEIFDNNKDLFKRFSSPYPRTSPRPPKYPPSMERLNINIPYTDEDRINNVTEDWRVQFSEMLAKIQTILIGVISGFVVIAPTFSVRYYGTPQAELLFLILWTGIQAAVFANIYRQTEATSKDFWKNVLVILFVAGRVYLQDPFLDISFKLDTVLESLVLFGGISLALDFCFWYNLIDSSPRTDKRE